ncbi:hypothetical protein BDZ91DRAFT_479220 [Kalaharituber pfeilii]|nr:hypothetical protein BDZ91DRAFT_479220 [Kalaharituber pfeilii]
MFPKSAKGIGRRYRVLSELFSEAPMRAEDSQSVFGHGSIRVEQSREMSLMPGFFEFHLQCILLSRSGQPLPSARLFATLVFIPLSITTSVISDSSPLGVQIQCTNLSCRPDRSER